MTLESQVISLDLAKRLKELGVKQESYFYWSEDYDPEDANNGGWWVIRYINPNEDNYSAFTVAELGEMLPDAYISWRSIENDYRCDMLDAGSMGQLQFADTEADARAKMLCYLLENNLITL